MEASGFNTGQITHYDVILQAIKMDEETKMHQKLILSFTDVSA